MVINVFPPRRAGVPRFESTFALQQDNWNDYSFQTLYHLYYRQVDDSSSPTMVGSVKIMRRGQTRSDGIQLSEPFELLEANYCSVGNSLDYYQRLNELPAEERAAILVALRDVVYQPELQRQFQEEEIWSVSLFRDNPNPSAFLADATAVLTGQFSELPDIEEDISFLPASWSNPVVFNFSSPSVPRQAGEMRRRRLGGVKAHLPRRVNVIIGRNGSGKSTLLSRMARVGFASPSDRATPQFRSLGILEPSSVGFTKIIAISYSPFDNFLVPGLYEKDLEQIMLDIEKGRGRYIYAGIRDIVEETRDDWSKKSDRDIMAEGGDIPFGEDRRSTTRLKSLIQLAEEFQRLLGRITENGDDNLLATVLEPILVEPSFAEVNTADLIPLSDGDAHGAFLGLSTGHKIVLHVVASLVGHTTRNSLVLFDEPEMHLHPPLIAALMKSIRIVLEEKNAFAVVSTHSPVVLQETLTQHVQIIRRIGDECAVERPSRETFGENVGVLTYDAFGLIAASTDFHECLDLLIEEMGDVERIDELFSPSLSAQARSYVVASLSRRAKE